MSDPTNATFRQMMLEARIDQAARGVESLGDLDEKFAQADARWSDDELRESVAVVLADALREAGRTDRNALIRALAPNILSTVRNEIGNAHPEIIEALSPRIGELIRAAVSKAVEDLQRQIDEAMPVDLWIASLRATLTGTPTTGWIIKDESGFRVIEAFLIERGSGLILAQDRPEGTDEDGAALDDDLLGGMIAALDSFARDAFGSGGMDALRQLTLSAGTIYLRASPTKILALRCTGVAPQETEEQIDQLLDRVIRRLREGEEGDIPVRLLEMNVASAQGDDSSVAAVLGKGALAACVALLVVWSHFALEGANRDRWADAILAIARDDPAMTGYPVVASHGEDRVTLTGLVPDRRALADMRTRLARYPVPVDIAFAMPVAGRRLEP